MLKTKPKICRSCFLVACFIFAAFISLVQCNGQDPIDSDKDLNWAILTDEATRKSGFPDLLAVDLAGSGYSMIERDQIQQLQNELLLGVGSTVSSLRQPFELGKRVGANRLILCQSRFHNSLQQPNQSAPDSMRVVVCDCDLAARIGVFDFKMQPAVELSKSVAQFLESNRVQFESGIQRVVGIVPFGCKNIGLDFAELGPRSFDTLADQLLSVPGVALIEWESARDLTKELISQEGIANRRVPVVIEVDYLVLPGDENTAPTVELTLRVQKGDEPKSTSATVPLSKMDQWLREQVLPIVLDDRDAKLRLSETDQLRLLKGRAASLFRLGDLAHCTQVREVILQITPDDLAERRRIIEDYDLLPSSELSPNRLQGEGPIPPTPLKVHSQSCSRDHFEYMVRNGLLSSAEGIERFKLLTNREPNFLNTTNKFTLSPLDLELALAMLDADEKFVRAIAPAILKLKRTANYSNDDELRSRLDWMDSVLAPAINRAWFHSGSAESRILAARLIADIVPEEFPTRAQGAWIFQPRSFGKKRLRIAKRKGVLTEGYNEFTVGFFPHEALPFLSTLTSESHRHLQLYGLLAKTSFRFADDAEPIVDGSNPNAASKEELWQETEEILELAKQTPSAERHLAGGPLHREYEYSLFKALTYRDRWIRRNTETVPMAAAPYNAPAFGRLRIEKIDLELPKLDAYSETRWVPDGPDHDLVYDRKRVYRLDRKGVFNLISPDDGYDFFDAEFVWKLRKGEGGKCTVTVLDRSGKAFLSNEAIELPPCDEWQTISVGKRRGVIIGAIKQTSATWCALLELKGDKLQTRVFHEAREPYDPYPGNNFSRSNFSDRNLKEARERTNLSIHSQIQSHWHAFGSDGRGEMLLLGRRGLNPLRIDLNTLKVSVSNLKSHLYSNVNLAPQDIVIANQKLYVSISHVMENDLNSPSIEPKKVIGMDHMEQVRAGNATSGSQFSGMIVHDSWLLLPGETWYRYNLKTKLTERLVPTRLPREFASDLGCYSSIHGLILWHPPSENWCPKGRVHRVTILPK